MQDRPSQICAFESVQVAFATVQPVGLNVYVAVQKCKCMCTVCAPPNSYLHPSSYGGKA